MQISDELVWLCVGNILANVKMTLDKGQLIDLGSALLKAGQAMPRRDKLEVVGGGLVTP